MWVRPHRTALCVLASVLVSIAVFRECAAAQTPTTPSAPTQTTSKDDPERQHAIDLFRAGKFVEAMPLFEKLAADHPSDAGIKEGWAFSVMGYAAILSDPELRKKARARARSIALQAKELGDNSSLLQVVLELPEDGSEPLFSDRKEVDEAMKTAEANFVRGDYDKARDGYLHVLMSGRQQLRSGALYRRCLFQATCQRQRRRVPHR